MDLSDWHCRLQDHFEALRATRDQVHKVFALEHGLNEGERASLDASIRAHIAEQAPKVQHSLAWVVYAAEVGYRYAGTEYWRTFESETDGWLEHGDRYWIRRQFQRFAVEYGGAKPVGAWAECFSIICWPITHSILPRDLQRHLARVLFESRGAIQQEHLSAPALLGHELARHSQTGSDRFGNFLQQHELVGQIAIALLLDGTAKVLELAALQRIVRDLEETEKGKEWLRLTRHRVQQTVRGLAPNTRSNSHPITPSRPVIPTCGFLLIPGPQVWQLCLQTPEYAGVAPKSPEVRQWLATTRCRVEGSTSPPLPPSALLFGSRQVRLDRWPRPEKPLLRFERVAPPAASSLLDALVVPTGSLRLFKIQPDGTGRVVRSGVVRPRGDYILVSPDALPEIPGGSPVSVNDREVNAVRFTLPARLDQTWLSLLGQLRLSKATSIRVWPVGMVPAAWDDAGRGEWVEGDPIALGIEVSGECSAVDLYLDGKSTLKLKPGMRLDNAWYVQLPPLDLGLHRLTCSITELFSTPDRPRGGTYALEIAVREPRELPPTGNSQSPLQLLTDPPYPTLEQVWEDKVQLQLIGPAGSSVSGSFQLLARYGGEVLGEARLPPLSLPLDRAAWSQTLEGFRDDDQIQGAYSRASAGTIIFDTGELGRLRLFCERTYTPLRWSVQRCRNREIVRLVDETGESRPTTVSRFYASHPAVEHRLSLDTAMAGIAIDGAVLYLAENGLHASGIVAAQRRWNWQELQQLRQEAVIREAVCDAASLQQLIFSIRSWRQAHQSGNLIAANCQRSAGDALQSRLLKLLCGDRFAAAEAAYLAAGSQGLRVAAFGQLLGECTRNPQVLKLKMTFLQPTNRALFAGEPATMRATGLSERVSEYGLCPSFSGMAPADRTWLTTFALCLVSAPECLPAWAEQRFQAGLTDLIRHPELVRIARSFVLALNDPPDATGNKPEERVYWEW